MKGETGKRVGGFTLIELLAVIAIISILAALILPALVHAKSAARNVKCQSQLKQIGMGVSMYAVDFESYPRFFHHLSSHWKGPVETWADLISAYTLQRYEDLLYQCPDYTGLTANDGLGYLHPIGSYGMNAKGTYNNGLSPIEGVMHYVFLPEQRVVRPAEMIGFGDTITWPAMGESTISMGYGELNFHDGPKIHFPDSDPHSEKVKRVQKKRHRGRFNMLFVDGHIEHGTRAKFYTHRPEVRRRWNYMNSTDPNAGNY